MIDTARFLTCMTEEFMDNYSRAMFRLLSKQDLAFRHYGAKGLHLGKNDCDAVDRFAFLFLCKKMMETGDEDLSLNIYSLRKTGFRLAISERSGICIQPTIKADEEDGRKSALEQFKAAWFSIPQKKRDWIKAVFDSMPYDFPDTPDILRKDVVA